MRFTMDIDSPVFPLCNMFVTQQTSLQKIIYGVKENLFLQVYTASFFLGVLISAGIGGDTAGKSNNTPSFKCKH